MNSISSGRSGPRFLLIGLAGLLAALSTAPSALAQPAADKVLASGQYANDPDLRCDILEVKRVSGGALNIRWRVVNTSAQPGGLAATSGKPIAYNYSWNQLYYTDPAENKKYGYLTDTAGNRIVQMYEGQYAPGQQRMNWAKFPAPPPGSKKISIYIPQFPPFDDIPVSE
jgi:hypothetical protein